MTKQIKSALSTLNKWKNCCAVDKDDCIQRICENCEFNYDKDNIEESVDTAIRSLNAWEEVLQELESRYNGNDETVGTFTIGITECINIINQKLAEIEEVR